MLKIEQGVKESEDRSKCPHCGKAVSVSSRVSKCYHCDVKLSGL